MGELSRSFLGSPSLTSANFGDGTKLTPSIAFTSELSSGIFLQAPGVVSLVGDGSECIRATGITNSVNCLNVRASIAGVGPTIEVDGTDTNIDINIQPKGTGVVGISSNVGIQTGASPAQYRLDVGENSYFAVNGLFAHTIQHNNASSTYWSLAPRNGGNFDIAVSTTDPRPSGGTLGTGSNAISIKSNKDTEFLGGVDISSTTAALIVSRMTTTQRDAMAPLNGMIIYNTTTATMQGRVNGAWIAL